MCTSPLGIRSAISRPRITSRVRMPSDSPYGVSVGERDRLVDRVEPDDRRHRAEDLLAGTPELPVGTSASTVGR